MTTPNFHPESLVTGFTFLLIGLLFLFDRTGVWDLDVTYVWPLVLIGLGAAVLAGSATQQTSPNRK